MRCKGNYQACYSPWYTVWNGDKGDRYVTLSSCQDKSDQIFPIGETCDKILQEKMDFHDHYFCNNPDFILDFDLKSKTICINKTLWLEEMREYLMTYSPYDSQEDLELSISKLKDPHFCQLSCSEPRSDCAACTNSKYFNCTKSGHCVHPELVCDGHPQCTEGEDEDLSRCHLKYIEKKIVQPYASYKCKSLYYQKMDIYATPCNKIQECFDNSDENNCKEGSLITQILLGSSFVVIVLYLSLDFYLKNSETMVDKLLMTLGEELSSLLTKYELNHDDPKVVGEVNIYFLHIILTQSLDVSQDAC